MIWGFDNPEFIRRIYESKDIDTIWIEYFDAIKSIVKQVILILLDILDLIKVFKLHLKDVRIIAKDALLEIKKSNMVLEINPAGLRKANK